MITLWQLKQLLRNLQQGRSSEQGTKNRGDNTSSKSFLFNDHFWDRRPDGVAMNKALRIVYLFEFDLSADRNEGFLEMKEAEANEQHKVSSVRSEQLLRRGNLSRSTLLWVTADLL